jgi:hypothetical protein
MGCVFFCSFCVYDMWVVENAVLKAEWGVGKTVAWKVLGKQGWLSSFENCVGRWFVYFDFVEWCNGGVNPHYAPILGANAKETSQ